GPQLVTIPEVWFSPSEGFPSFAPDAIAVEARLFPWVSWAWGVRGMADAPLSAWPAQLTLPDAERIEVFNWPGAAPPLLYPAATGWQPSLRLERLRDGIEDYEYLTAASLHAAAKGPTAAEFRDALPKA